MSEPPFGPPAWWTPTEHAPIVRRHEQIRRRRAFLVLLGLVGLTAFVLGFLAFYRPG